MTGRRVQFIKDYDYKPIPSVTIGYKAGQIKFVRLECAERAVALGKALYFQGVDGVPRAGVVERIAQQIKRRKDA